MPTLYHMYGHSLFMLGPIVIVKPFMQASNLFGGLPLDEPQFLLLATAKKRIFED